MKKAYTITPEEYYKKLDEIRKIEYNYGYQCGPDYRQYRLSSSTPEKIKKRYEKLKSETENLPKPKDSVFFRNTDLYNLWLNRETDEPVTAKELFNIVTGISGAIDAAKSAAVWSNFDGR